MGFGAFAIYLYMHTRRQPKEVLFQAWFQQQGGWMSPALKVGKTQYGNGLVLVGDGGGGSIHKSQKILEIPVDLLMTQESAAAKVQAAVVATSSPKIFTKIVDAIGKHLDNPLDQQDVWIALELMLERCKNGDSSRYAPYLDMLLPTKVPRLATFTTHELDLLQDEEMKQYGLSQSKALVEVFVNGIEDIYNDDKKCWTPESFFHSVALSASRAMILDGKKYLTPMAEMINHSDNNQDTSSSSFQANHKLEGRKLVVYADRAFSGRGGEELVEEYGKLDNSLYISAFGFVPRDNPHHCVLIGGSVCVKRTGEASDESALVKLAMPDCTSQEEECWKHRDERVREYLQREAQQKLSTYPTSLEEDQALLANFDPDKARVEVRVAIEFRMEEKKVLLQLARG